MPTRCLNPWDNEAIGSAETDVSCVTSSIFGHASRRFRPRHSPEPRREGQVCTHRHLGVQRGRVGQVADASANRVGMRDHVETIHQDPPRGGKEVARQNAQRGCFAGTVEPEQADDFAGLNRAGERPDGAALPSNICRGL